MDKTCPFRNGTDCQKQCALYNINDGCALLSIGKQLFDIKRELDVMRIEANSGNANVISTLNGLKNTIKQK